MPLNPETGRERPDQTPHTLAVDGLRRPESLDDMVRRLVRHEMFQRAAAQAGHETFEEADDFDVDDDPDLKSPYELDDSLPPFNEKELRAQIKRETDERHPRPPKPKPGDGPPAAPEPQPTAPG